MKLYDECINGVSTLLKDIKIDYLSLDDNWPDAGKNQLIFQSDTAYELGGGNSPAISSIALTDNKDFVPDDEIILIGNDIRDIKSDCSFARISIIRVNEEALGTGDALYNTIRRIEYSRYHLNPEGYMMRISAFSHREAARIGKDAIKKGLNFAKIGTAFINAYKKQAQVEAVKLIFITDPQFPFAELEKIMKKSEDITSALDHLMKDLKMDCHTCSLKEVCEEVEELYNKDFAKK